MRYIKDFEPGDRISGVYLCKSKQELTSSKGKPYLSLILSDKTGNVDTKVWNLTDGIEEFDPPQFVFVDGDVKLFRSEKQLSLRRMRVAGDDEYIAADYVPASKQNVEDMYADLLGYIDSVEEPHLHELLQMYFVRTPRFIESFKRHSAAKSIHHGFAGGLLEHTLSVTRLCDFYAHHYPLLNRDLLITAAICHDIGKTKELSDFPLNEYTDEGQLLGHIVTGVMMVRDAVLRIQGFPETLAIELEHCIVAHHGQLEFGSPKRPALMEAMALHLADLTDARMETITELFESSSDTLHWLGYNRSIESNIRKTSRPDMLP